jgi:hypothetical protein
MKNAVFWDVGCVALERIDVLEENIASIFRVTRIGYSCHRDGGDMFL